MKHFIVMFVLLITACMSVVGKGKDIEFNALSVMRQDAFFDMRSDTNYCKVDSLQNVIYREYEEALKDCETYNDSTWTTGIFKLLNSQAQQTRDIIAKR